MNQYTRNRKPSKHQTTNRILVMLEKPILQGEKIYLRPLGLEDAPAIFASLSDEESMRLTGTQDSFTLEQVEAFYAKVPEADDRIDYAIVLGDQSDVMVGEVVLNNIDWENKSANFRIALSNQSHFGKGYGSEATQLIIKHGFEVLDLHRIELEVYDFNPRAIHVYRKVGFIQEGIRRDVLLWDGKYQSAIVMAMLKSDYVKSQKV